MHDAQSAVAIPLHLLQSKLRRLLMQSIMDSITRILRTVFDDETIVATPQLNAGHVDGWDSLAHVRLMLTIERAFCIRFTAAEANSFANVGDLAAAIAAKTGGQEQM